MHQVVVLFFFIFSPYFSFFLLCNTFTSKHPLCELPSGTMGLSFLSLCYFVIQNSEFVPFLMKSFLLCRKNNEQSDIISFLGICVRGAFVRARFGKRACRHTRGRRLKWILQWMMRI